MNVQVFSMCSRLTFDMCFSIARLGRSFFLFPLHFDVNIIFILGKKYTKIRVIIVDMMAHLQFFCSKMRMLNIIHMNKRENHRSLNCRNKKTQPRELICAYTPGYTFYKNINPYFQFTPFQIQKTNLYILLFIRCVYNIINIKIYTQSRQTSTNTIL